MKHRIAVEMHCKLGACLPYDLFSWPLALYSCDAIDVGVEVLPTLALQSLTMADGPAYEDALKSLARLGRGVPAVPLVIVGIEP